MSARKSMIKAVAHMFWAALLSPRRPDLWLITAVYATTMVLDACMADAKWKAWLAKSGGSTVPDNQPAQLKDLFEVLVDSDTLRRNGKRERRQVKCE